MNLRTLTGMAAVLILSICCLAPSAFADGIYLSALQADPFTCGTLEAPGLHTIYVYHMVLTGATGCAFRIEGSPDLAWTYVSETHPYPYTNGNTRDGMIVCYNNCLAGPALLVAAVTYMSNGATPQGAEIRVIPYPGADTIEVMDCNFDVQYTTGTSINFWGCSVDGCCQRTNFTGSPYAFDCSPPLATEQSTWGHVKALFR